MGIKGPLSEKDKNAFGRMMDVLLTENVKVRIMAAKNAKKVADRVNREIQNAIGYLKEGNAKEGIPPDPEWLNNEENKARLTAMLESDAVTPENKKALQDYMANPTSEAKAEPAAAAPATPLPELAESAKPGAARLPAGPDAVIPVNGETQIVAKPNVAPAVIAATPKEPAPLKETSVNVETKEPNTEAEDNFFKIFDNKFPAPDTIRSGEGNKRNYTNGKDANNNFSVEKTANGAKFTSSSGGRESMLQATFAYADKLKAEGKTPHINLKAKSKEDAIALIKVFQKQGRDLNEIASMSCPDMPKGMSPQAYAKQLIAESTGQANRKAPELPKEDKPPSPLMAAMQSGKLDAAQSLVDKGANINEVDKHGQTLTQQLMSEDGYNPKTIEFAVKNGADIHKRDNEGMNAVDLALFQKADAVLKTFGIENPAEHPDYGMPNTSQAVLNDKLLKYCEATNQSPGFFNKDKEGNLTGECSGWTFLHQYYAANDNEAGFTDLQNYIANADISKLKPGDKDAVLERAVNDLTMFSNRRTLGTGVEQRDRMGQWKIAGDDNLKLESTFKFETTESKDKDQQISKGEVQELLSMAQKFPNTWVDIQVYNEEGKRHALGVSVTEEGKFKYFNSDNPLKKGYEVGSAAEVENLISNSIPNAKVKAFNGYHFATNYKDKDVMNDDFKFPKDQPPLKMSDALANKMLANAKETGQKEFSEYLMANTKASAAKQPVPEQKQTVNNQEVSGGAQRPGPAAPVAPATSAPETSARTAPKLSPGVIKKSIDETRALFPKAQQAADKLAELRKQRRAVTEKQERLNSERPSAEKSKQELAAERNAARKERKELTQQINDTKKELNGLAKEGGEALKAADSEVKKLGKDNPEALEFNKAKDTLDRIASQDDKTKRMGADLKEWRHEMREGMKPAAIKGRMFDKIDKLSKEENELADKGEQAAGQALAYLIYLIMMLLAALFGKAKGEELEPEPEPEPKVDVEHDQENIAAEDKGEALEQEPAPEDLAAEDTGEDKDIELNAGDDEDLELKDDEDDLKEQQAKVEEVEKPTPGKAVFTPGQKPEPPKPLAIEPAPPKERERGAITKEDSGGIATSAQATITPTAPGPTPTEPNLAQVGETPPDFESIDLKGITDQSQLLSDAITELPNSSIASANAPSAGAGAPSPGMDAPAPSAGAGVPSPGMGAPAPSSTAAPSPKAEKPELPGVKGLIAKFENMIKQLEDLSKDATKAFGGAVPGQLGSGDVLVQDASASILPKFTIDQDAAGSLKDAAKVDQAQAPEEQAPDQAKAVSQAPKPAP